MARFFCGGFGGIVSLVALLIVSNGEPLASYVTNLSVPGVGGKFVGYLIKATGLFGLGAFWVWINSEKDKLRAFQLGIAAPAIITGMIATYEAKNQDNRHQNRADQAFSFVSTAHAQVAPPDSSRPSSVFQDIIGGILNEPIITDLPIEKLPERFSGNDRRSASDQLISLYPDNKEKVVNAVLGAIQLSGDNYRVNIYVARTLGLIPGGWQGNENQKQAIEALKKTRAYNDITFKENVDRALTNWRAINSSK